MTGILLGVLIKLLHKAILSNICERLFLSTFVYNQHVIRKTHSEPCQISKVKSFAKLVNSFQPLTIFAKGSILGVRQCSGYASLL